MPESNIESEQTYHNDISGFRQPMVTSIGIILGFQLAFLANWALTAETVPAVSGFADTVLALTFMASVALFTTALFRILNNRIQPDAGTRYRQTLRLYLLALMLAFSGLAIALFL